MEKLLTAQQVCELLQIKRSTLYDWTHIGFIPHYKFPKGNRFKVSELERWLKRRKLNGRQNYQTPIPD